MKAAVAALALIAACATSRGDPAPTAPTTTAAPCDRSVEADTETARARFDAGRLDEALLYVRGLDPCPEALRHPPYLTLALDIYEEQGMLLEAWSVVRVIADLAAGTNDAEGLARIAARRERFAATYALVTFRPDRRKPPKIAYAGPVADAATQAQLDAIAAGRGVRVDDATYGAWLLPGTYTVDGVRHTLAPGARLDVE